MPDASSDGIIFALLDNGRNGLCCENGQGFFQVFLGDIADNIVVAKGSEFKRVQHFEINLHQGLVDGKYIATPTPSPMTEQVDDGPSDEGPTTSKGKFYSASTAKKIVFLAAMYLMI